MHRRLLILLILLGVVGATAWMIFKQEPPLLPTHDELLASLLPLTIEQEGHSIELFVEVADTAQKRSEGLKGRKNLSTQSGMLFVFEAENVKNFWMQNTLIPLDILWLNRDKTIIGHDTMVPCQPTNGDEACPMTSSPSETLYALEVHNQFVEDNAIEIGNKTIFSITP